MPGKNLNITIAILLFPLLLLAQTDSYPVKLIKPAGGSLNGYPLMEEYKDTSFVNESVIKIINNSAIKDILEINRICQQYLLNLGINERLEPAYLALTINQGGFAKKGFFLISEQKDTLDHTGTPYVDIMLDRILSDYTGLMSFTQLYPHELAHVIYGQVSLNDSVDPESRNVDMHYFPVITDYSTAFNEGFAIHFENISRMIEENEEIRAGTRDDLDRIEQRTPTRINGFLNDIKYPFRLGYYRSSVIMWFQQYEDYRRHVHALDGSIKHINYAPEIGSIEDQLTIRNMGILYSEEFRNPVQSCATEGVIASLFTKLFQSELGLIYYEGS